MRSRLGGVGGIYKAGVRLLDQRGQKEEEDVVVVAGS